MKREPLVFIGVTDIAGKVRGKALPAAVIDAGGEAQVGWTPTNVQQTCFGDIAPSPYGALGDLIIVGDRDARARVDFGDDGPIEDLMLGDVVHLDGTPWECCTRANLDAALARLWNAAGVRPFGAFEQEFHLPERAGPRGETYAFTAFRSERHLCETIIAALASGGVAPEAILKEFGPDQFEVTVKPTVGRRIADEAGLSREIVRAAGERCSRRVSFAPLVLPGGIGNGVHVHLSFVDAEGRPVAYDGAGPHGMSRVTGAFIAGVLRRLPEFLALTAPSVVSYRRLVPNRWSAAFDNLGAQDREAAVRLCPIRSFEGDDPAPRFQFEFRACDAAASPHLALAAIVHAGAEGIEDDLPTPTPTSEDLSLLSTDALTAGGHRRLPQTLDAALDEMQASAAVRDWFPGRFTDVYLAHKRHEIALLADLDEPTLCAAYQEVY